MGFLQLVLMQGALLLFLWGVVLGIHSLMHIDVALVPIPSMTKNIECTVIRSAYPFDVPNLLLRLRRNRRVRKVALIESIEISGRASYMHAPAKMDGLKAVNYIYGPNGAGKTTVSRVIAESGYSLRWARGTELETMVYNRDFVDANFNQSADLKGIFTLGQGNIDTQIKIEQAKKSINELTNEIEGLNGNLDGRDGKRTQLSCVEADFTGVCWKVKTKHDTRLKAAFSGYRGGRELFKKKVVEECAKKYVGSPPNLDELNTKAASVFGPAPSSEPLLKSVVDAKFLELEAASVLQRRVLGKDDVDIAALIQKLGNSDWVRQGVVYFRNADGVCPFCQRVAPDHLASSLEEYFDETFEQDSKAIAAVEADYRLEGERLQETMSAAIDSGSRFLDVEPLRAEKEIFDSRFQMNQQRIAAKTKEPSQIVTLEPLREVLGRIKQIFDSANEKIQAHNDMVANREEEALTLKGQVWRYLAQVEMAGDYKKYSEEKQRLKNAIESMDSKIREKREARSQLELQVRKMEKTATSVHPTVDAINRLLQQFGFNNFSLGATKGNHYRLVRGDGSDAKETLSEGERSFVTFLYFYHLLKGSESESGMTRERVAVFDDPVSSLDSDVLFVVSSLIRKVIEEAKDQRGAIRQAFVLTHNVYFHKEVTFSGRRNGGRPDKHETFWTINKVNSVSRIKGHSNNPIKSSYELLWSELRTPDLTNQNIQNTMRRILESYFRILGQISFDEILDKFDGEEKLICRSLLSWVHEGSHSIPDDLYHTLDESTMGRYLTVFKKIFAKYGQLNHYNMMMGEPFSLESVAEMV